MSTNSVQTDQFQHVVAVGEDLNRAVQVGDMVCVRTSRSNEFVLISIETAEIVARIAEDRLPGGLFSVWDSKVYVPFYDKLYQLSASGSTEILQVYQEEMFGAQTVMIRDGFLFVISHNGLFVFDVASLDLRASFKNANKSTVSGINFSYNSQTGRLYVANLRNDTSQTFSVVCADARKKFATLWTAELTGKMSKVSDYGVNVIYESARFLACPVYNEKTYKSELVLLDKENGEVRHSLPNHKNHRIVYAGDLAIVREIAKNEIGAWELESQTQAWTVPLPEDCKGFPVVIRDKVLLACKGSGHLEIELATGTSTRREHANALVPVFGPDLRPSTRFFLRGQEICWD